MEEEKNNKNEGGKPEEEKEISFERDENLDDSVVAEETLGETAKKLREKLKKCQEEKNEYLIGWQKERADFQNYKKKVAGEMEEFKKFAHENFAEELIPVLQSFEMAFSNKEAWEKADKNWRTGVEYIHSQLLKILEEQGVKEVNPVGEKFDPAKHDPAEFVPAENEKDDQKILEVVNKGYSLNGKILRPARVKVGEFKKNA